MRGDPRRADGMSDPPGLDCVSDGHIWVDNIEVGAFPTANGEVPHASWCLWCGGGVSNELLPDEGI